MQTYLGDGCVFPYISLHFHHVFPIYSGSQLETGMRGTLYSKPGSLGQLFSFVGTTNMKKLADPVHVHPVNIREPKFISAASCTGNHLKPPVFYHVSSEKHQFSWWSHRVSCFFQAFVSFFPVEKPSKSCQVAELHPQPPARLHQQWGRENGLRCLALGAGSGETAAEWADQGEAEEISEVSRCHPGLELLSLDWWWLSI